MAANGCRWPRATESGCRWPRLTENGASHLRRKGDAMAVTAKMIAEQLNLSEAAVSMALNGKPGVSAKTRKRVVEIARQLGFDFGRLKSTRMRREADELALLTYSRRSFFGSAFFDEVRDGIRETARQAETRVRFVEYDASTYAPGSPLDVVPVGCEGLIVMATEMQDADFRLFDGVDVPTVFLDNPWAPQDYDSVSIENYPGAYAAAGYLLSKYHEVPGHLRASSDLINFELRRIGLGQSVRGYGGAAVGVSEVRLPASVDGAYEEMLGYLDAGGEVRRSYFADNDDIAMGAMRAFRERGLRVPLDVAVVGFDNVRYAPFTDPPLTTVDVPKFYMGQVAVERLLTMIESGRAPVEGLQMRPVHISVNTRLIVRKSA